MEEHKFVKKIRGGWAAVLVTFVITVFISAGGIPEAFAPQTAYADMGGFTTEEYNTKIVTDENFVYHVSEIIKVDFNQRRHGIYRYIPEDSRLYSIKNVNVEDYEFETGSEDGNLMIKIGSADEFMEGKQTYKISYDIVGYKDRDSSKDRLAIDLLPTGWNTAIESASCTLILPKAVDKDKLELYSGAYASTSGDNSFKFNFSNGGKKLTAVSTRTLPQGVGLTIETDLPEGYWVNPADRMKTLPGALGILGALGVLMIFLWFAFGRDKQVVSPVEFYPPNNLDPLQVAYLASDNINPKDTAAMFMYYANKGYIKISQADTKHKKRFKLKRLGPIDQSESEAARKVFNTLFSGKEAEVSLRDLPDKFGEMAAHIKSDVVNSLGGTERPFTSRSVMARRIGLGFSFVIPFLAGAACSYYSGAGLWLLIVFAVLAAIMCFLTYMFLKKTDAFQGTKKKVGIIVRALILIVCMFVTFGIMQHYVPSLAFVSAASFAVVVFVSIFVRQRENNDMFGRVMGFRNFIETAEQEKLKAMAEQDPEYFFNIMPYAFIFGMSNKWADKFADFRIPTPKWYDGTNAPFDPLFTGYILSTAGSSVNSSISAFYREMAGDIVGDAGGSGGSFSGGGFGGGGGGSW